MLGAIMFIGFIAMVYGTTLRIQDWETTTNVIVGNAMVLGGIGSIVVTGVILYIFYLQDAKAFKETNENVSKGQHYKRF